jgi:pilus assembly protein CpaE
MNIHIVTDDAQLAETARLLVVKDEFDCPVSNVFSLQAAVQSLGSEKPDLILVILEPDPDEALAVIHTLRGQCSVPIIAIGGSDDTHWVLKVVHSGVDDYLDIAAIEAELRDALPRWKARLTRDRPLGKILCAIAPSGGSGTSTLVANLGVKLAQEFSRVLLMDLKLLTDDLASLLDLNPTYSIADLCLNVSSLDRTLFAKTLTSHSTGVELLAPPRRMSDAPSVSSTGVRQALMLGRSLYPFVLVDLDMEREKTVREVLLQSDTILLVIRPEVASLRNTRRLIDHLESLGVSSKTLKAVLNFSGEPGEVPMAKIEEALRLKVFHSLPSDAKNVNDCNNVGVPVVTEYPRSRYSHAITELATKLKEHLRMSGSTRQPVAGPGSDNGTKAWIQSSTTVQAASPAPVLAVGWPKMNRIFGTT